MFTTKPRRKPLVAIAALWLFVTADAAPRVRKIEREHLTVHVKLLGPGALDPAQAVQFDVDPDRGGGTAFAVRWPDASRLADVSLAAVEKASLQHEHVLELRAVVALPGGRSIRSERTLSFGVPTTTLFEIYREGDTPLVLALRIEGRTETRFVTTSEYTEPVKLRLQIQRVVDGDAITLENDLLQTFVDEPVVYEFRLGRVAEADAARIELLPLRIVGDIIELEMDVSGQLPLDGELTVVSRRRKLLATRGAASTMSFETGEPPSGYRFVVVPDF